MTPAYYMITYKRDDLVVVAWQVQKAFDHVDYLNYAPYARHDVGR